MNEIEVSSIDLVEGGNVFKQGHYLTLGYIPRDESGALVDLTGKVLSVTLWGRKGIGFEADAVYADGVLRFTLNETIPAGEYNVEFTATSSTDATYRKKFPTSASSGRIVVRQSADDLGAMGVQVVTVAQLKAEQQALQASYEQTVDGKIVELETTVTEGIGAFTEDTEVINARQGKATLGENLNGITAQLADIPSLSSTLKSAKSVKYIAHRGMSGIAPENTIPAFEMAGKIGIWGAECDIIVTSDNEWVVIHDYTVDRTTNGTGEVEKMTLAQLKALAIDGGNNVDVYPNLKIPTLEEFLLVCKKHSMVPVIEIKSTSSSVSYDKLVNQIKSYGFEENCIILCGNVTILNAIRSRSQNIVIHYLADITQANIDLIKNYGNIGLDAWAGQVTKENIELAHKNGMPVNIWPVDSYQDAKKYINYGVDYITTNFIAGVL